MVENHFWTLAKPVKPDFHAMEPKSNQFWDFEDFLDFGDPETPNIFEDFDPPWPLQRSYCLENVPILSNSF